MYSGSGQLDSSDGTKATAQSSSAPVSMEEYIIERVPLEKWNVAVSTPINIAQIARRMKNWEDVAPLLGLSHPQIEAIKKDYRKYEEQKLAV